MVTWTFDLLAFVVGAVVGTFFAGFIVCFVEMRDKSWDDGFSSGFDAKKFVEELEKSKKKE